MPPSQILLPHGHRFRWGEDTARYLLDPGDEFRQPFLRIPGGARFTWPVGTEGFSYQSNAALGIHKYIGKADIEVNVIYRDEPHITMTGTFPGRSGPVEMRKLLDILEAPTARGGKILFLPFIFPRIQFVAAEDWQFGHESDDRSRSISYSITFLKVGMGSVISIPQPEPPEGEGPTPSPARYIRVKDGYRTMRLLAKRVYKDGDRWNRIYTLNRKKIDTNFKRRGIPRHKYPLTKLPLGMQIRY